jgi:thiamine kinase-like enzyme
MPNKITDDIKDQLGHDLWVLVQAMDSPLVEAVTITDLPSSRLARVTFRLQFADGRTLKGRRLDKAKRAKRMQDICRMLDQGCFPRILARYGSALVEEWIEGETLNGVKLGPELLHRCGAILGSVHSISPPEEIWGPPRQTPDAWQAKLAEQVNELLKLGALTRRSGRRLLDIAQANAPRNISVGFIHRDLCPENIVLHAPDEPYVIDNELLLFDAYDYDLGRTWYRWPMSETERNAFFAGYRQYREPASFFEHFSFWAICVLVNAAWLRLNAQTPDPSVPTARLKELLLRLEKGAKTLWSLEE